MGQGGGMQVSVQLGRETGIVVPADFTGLSFESLQLADPNFFSLANAGLLGHIQRMGPRGVLRIGGNSSEFLAWDRAAVAPSQPEYGPAPDGKAGKKLRRFVVTPQALTNLAQFLKASGWGLLFGLNLGTGSARDAADLGKAVAEAVGPSLIALQFGNEPDLYSRNGLRTPQYGAQEYLAEWEAFSQAILAAAPGVPLAGPDVAFKPDWLSAFARQESQNSVLLTGHYYAEGPPTSPTATIERLLSPGEKVRDEMAKSVATASHAGLRFRMSEGNSCYNGGKRGVSDTFASALWGADYMLQAATQGFAGINFHGGNRGPYTPIAGTLATGFEARPLFYGMLLAGHFAGAHLVATRVASQGPNLAAYAAYRGTQLLVALLNKDLAQPASVTLASPKGENQGQAWRLAAPAINAISGVTLAGATVSQTGNWSPTVAEPVQGRQGQFQINLPAASGALLFLQ